jgi:hypothetical protein
MQSGERIRHGQLVTLLSLQLERSSQRYPDQNLQVMCQLGDKCEKLLRLRLIRVRRDLREHGEEVYELSTELLGFPRM